MRFLTAFAFLIAVMGILPAAALGQFMPPPPPGPLLSPPGVTPAPVIPPFPGEMRPDSQLRHLRIEDGAEESPVWLGLQLSPVPLPLAAHLQLDANGLMVRNVFRDSPADRAGIEQFDVITEVNGHRVSGNVGAFIERLADRKPDDSVELSVVHEGKARTMQVKLADRPKDPARLKPKYDEFIEGPPVGPPDMRGRILRPGPDGWILEDLGPLPKMKELPNQLRMYIETLTKDGDSQTTEGRRVDKQGQVLHVLRKEDGSIEVKRYRQADGEGHAEPKGYANMEELRKGDREAFDLLNSAQRERRVLKGPGAFESREAWDDWLRKHGDKLKEFEHRMRESVPDKDWSKRWDEWNERFFQGPLKRFKHLPAESPDDEAKGVPAPRVRFELQGDGKVVVHVREGDAELTRTFDSEQSLKEKAPQLYERYQEMTKQLR
ncbi:MAG TPA: PDZ domain-containing protein [Phycisphaerae bacterium]|nr:PDZ domain-containing protein [Phycisphaerae bacterium]HRY70140.1 PDZ domain-containing protein [Phycisphaerae bacterium]HSA28280.1 PDZ domain-containing protein [Phycisphaerae bacterium]